MMRSEQLVAIAELKKRGGDEAVRHMLNAVKREVTSAISMTHSVRVADLVLVAPGSFRSRPAARCAVRPVWSGTGWTSSADWTSPHDGGVRRGCRSELAG